MSRGSEWIPLDKYLAQEFKSIKREFSMIEAMFSYTLDVDNGYSGTISGYSKLWGWSRNKVRRFVDGIRTEAGHIKDRKRTQDGHPIHFIDKGLWSKKDSKRTVTGQVKDTKHDTTTNPIILNPKSLSKDKELLFEKFWVSYGKKKDKKKCMSKFNKIKDSDLDIIFKTLPAYIISTPDIQFRKNPITYLNNESWNDEIVQNNNNSNNDSFEGVIYEGTKPEDIKW